MTKKDGNVVVFGVPITAEVVIKLLMVVFSLGVMWEKLDGLEKRVMRVEDYIFSRPDLRAKQ